MSERKHRWWHRVSVVTNERVPVEGGVLCIGLISCRRCGRSWPSRSVVTNAEFEQSRYGQLL